MERVTLRECDTHAENHRLVFISKLEFSVVFLLLQVVFFAGLRIVYIHHHSVQKGCNQEFTVVKDYTHYLGGILHFAIFIVG
jgi:hypothetical protein